MTTTIAVSIPTADGVCSATLHLPASGLPRPAVIMYPDAFGARDTIRSMADRLAGLGYVVLVPDLYYRSGETAPFDASTAFADAAERERLMGMIQALTAQRSVSDAGAFLDFLATRPEVAAGPVGTTGYCMGGRISLTVAGHHPDRIGAAASFHGGRLAVEEDPDSPHHLARAVNAVVYVGAAENDGSFPADQYERLQQAYTSAGVRHTIEEYQALHGFAVPDNPTYDEAAAERHWRAMEQLYSSALAS